MAHTGSLHYVFALLALALCRASAGQAPTQEKRKTWHRICVPGAFPDEIMEKLRISRLGAWASAPRGLGFGGPAVVCCFSRRAAACCVAFPARRGHSPLYAAKK